MRVDMKLKKIHMDEFDFYIDQSLAGISMDLFASTKREPEFMWILETEAAGEMGMDLGASIGYTTLYLSRYINKIIAIEPDKRTRKVLRVNIKKNNLKDRVEVFSFAISDRSGREKIRYAKKANSTTLCKPGKLDRILFSRRIETKTIDDMSISPDFVKMDIEGFEVEAINGGMDTFSKCPHCKILIEVHPSRYDKNRDFASSLRNLVDIGYRFKYVVSAGCAEPKVFKNKGYKPFKTFSYEKWTRGIFTDIKSEDAIELCSRPHREYIKDVSGYTDKVVRAILLVK